MNQRHQTWRRTCPHCQETIHIVFSTRIEGVKTTELMGLARNAQERHRMIQTRIDMDTF